MAIIQSINHDAGPPITNYWTITAAPTAYSVTAPSGLNGTAFGVEIDYNTPGMSENIRETIANVSSSTTFKFGFRVDLNTFNNPSVFYTMVQSGPYHSVDGLLIFIFIFFDNVSGNVLVGAQILDDDSSFQGISPQPTLTAAEGDVLLEFEITKSSALGVTDGSGELFKNGASQGTTGLVKIFTNYDRSDEFALRSPVASPASASGIVYVDQFFIDAAFLPTLAPMTKPVDIDADGSNLYLALLDNGNPSLIKMSTALNADGSTVFSPGAGDDIGVQCGRFDADVVWVAGALGGTNTVEKSEDGGSTFTVKDPATFGDVEAFVVGPDSDNRVLIADDNIDIQQTLDDGDTWTAINSGTGFNVNAIARLDKNVQESVFGNDAGANDNVNYSPNSGGDMEDFSSGFPTEDATRVIVN